MGWRKKRQVKTNGAPEKEEQESERVENMEDKSEEMGLNLLSRKTKAKRTTELWPAWYRRRWNQSAGASCLEQGKTISLGGLRI